MSFGGLLMAWLYWMVDTMHDGFNITSGIYFACHNCSNIGNIVYIIRQCHRLTMITINKSQRLLSRASSIYFSGCATDCLWVNKISWINIIEQQMVTVHHRVKALIKSWILSNPGNLHSIKGEQLSYQNICF